MKLPMVLPLMALMCMPCTYAAEEKLSDESAGLLETVTVTGALSRAAVEDFGGTSISQNDIAQTLPYSTTEILENVAGVHAFQKGGAGGSSYLSIRGGEPNYTLVLLNGIKMNDPTNSQGGAFDLNQIDPASLERIDIFRGSLSAVHGSDALSGIVNLQLRSLPAGESLLSASALADSKQGRGLSGSLGTGWQDGSVLTTASWSDSGELNDASTRERKQFIGRLTQEAGSVRIGGLVLQTRSHQRDFPEDSGGSRLAVNRQLETNESKTSVTSLELSRANEGRIQPHLSASWSKHTADTMTPAIYPGVLDYVPPITASSEFKRQDLTADVGVKFTEQLSAVVGASYATEHGLSHGIVDYGFLIPANFDIERSTTSVFGELTTRPSNKATVTFGTRYDDASTQSPKLTSRVSASYQPIDDSPTLYANWSSGYKLPSLYALAYPLIANPSLKSERSRSAEIGFQQSLTRGSQGNGKLRVGYFHTRFDDMIDFDPSLFTNVNRSWVVTQGAEAEMSRSVADDITVDVNASYTKTDAIDDVKLRYRPKWQADARMNWQATALLGTWWSLHYVSNYYDSSIPTGLIEAAGYVTVNIGLNYQYKYSSNQQLAISAAIMNMLDRNYEESVGTPATGRLLRIGLSLSR